MVFTKKRHVAIIDGYEDKWRSWKDCDPFSICHVEAERQTWPWPVSSSPAFSLSRWNVSFAISHTVFFSNVRTFHFLRRTFFSFILLTFSNVNFYNRDKLIIIIARLNISWWIYSCEELGSIICHKERFHRCNIIIYLVYIFYFFFLSKRFVMSFDINFRPIYFTFYFVFIFLFIIISFFFF